MRRHIVLNESTNIFYKLAAYVFNAEETTMKMEAVSPLPPGKNPFSVKIIIIIITFLRNIDTSLSDWVSHRNINIQRREKLKFKVLVCDNETENHCFNLL
jgi:hypothetical protein